MKVPFRVSGAHEAFVVDREMMKGFESIVVDHFTIIVSNSGNKVKKVMKSMVQVQEVANQQRTEIPWSRYARQNVVLGFAECVKWEQY